MFLYAVSMSRARLPACLPAYAPHVLLHDQTSMHNISRYVSHRMIRERYRKAAELSRVRGKMSALMINDLDAGIGRFENTQCTVNNQMVWAQAVS